MGGALPRRQPKRLVPSKVPWKPSPPSMINARFVRNSLLESSFWRTDLQETAAVKDKIEILRSRIATLEVLFDSPAGDMAETKRREELLAYVISLYLFVLGAQSSLGNSKPTRKRCDHCARSLCLCALLIMSKTTKMFPGFSKIYKRLSTTIRFVCDHDTLPDVDAVTRWCNKWRFTIKGAS